MNAISLSQPPVMEDTDLDILAQYDINYYEREGLTLGGFLVVYGTQRTLVLRAGLTSEEKQRGIEYLTDCLRRNIERHQGLYVWDGYALQ